MKIQDLEIKELLFTFLNVKGYLSNKVCKKGLDVPDYFIFETTLKKMDDSDINKFVESLNSYFNFEKSFERKGKCKIYLKFGNPDNISISQLLDELYKEIVKKQLVINSDDFSKLFAISSFCFRGSLDYTRKLYTVDLHRSRVDTYKNIEEFMKLTVLTVFNDQLNFNFRELQGEGTKRDTQFRMNLKFFYNNYLSELKKVNGFRYKQFKQTEDIIMEMSENKNNESFLSRVKFYLDNIVNNRDRLDDIKVSELRKQLDFSNVESDNESINRSNQVKAFAILTKPQECASCHNEYDNYQRTFKMRNSNSWYFEMHHVISFANSKYGIQTENIGNYVKLCPACHRALTPNRAFKEFQMKIISNILEYDKDTLSFVDTVRKETKSSLSNDEFVYEHLR